MSQDWNSLTTYFVRELGTPDSSALPISLSNVSKTKAELDSKIQAAFKTDAPVKSILRADNSRVDSDLGVVFLSEGTTLDVEFANKFYWVIRDAQRKLWIQEFRSYANNASFLSGEQTKEIFMQSGLSVNDLAQIWELADTDKDNMLSALEYLAAKFLIEARLSGEPLPSTLPAGLQPKNTRGSSKRNIAHAREVPAASHQLPISRPQQLSSSASEWSLRSKTRVAYDNLWEKHSRNGFVSGGVALQVFSESGIERSQLAQVWNLSDGDADHQLNRDEFFVALHLIRLLMKGYALPSSVPSDFIARVQSSASPSPVKKINRRGPEKRHVRQSSHPLILQPTSSTPTVPNFSSFPPSPAQQPPLNHSPTFDVRSPPVPPARKVTAPSQLSAVMESPQPFTPFESPQGKPFNIGQFNLPNSSSPPTPVPDFIQDIAQNIRERGEGTFLANHSSHSPVPDASQLVAGAEASLTGVHKFDSSEISRTSLIGGGTFAQVWSGSIPPASEIVAIKDMTYKSEKEIEIWKREVQLLAHLQNYNYLVKIKGYAISQDHLTIVMEFMEGGSLYDLIHNSKIPVTWSMLQKARILRHIAKGIDSIHKEGIVHRDLKSMNVLLDAKGIAKIADLGCSRFLREETMTIGIGSPLWMSPEVQRGGMYDFSADVFSYGVICYEVFNEKLPDYDIDRRTVVIPQDCIGYTIIHECTAKEPNRRPTATQLIESMDMLITSFCAAVGRVVRQNYKGDLNDLPLENDLTGWYNVLLAYGRETFDVLLSTGMNAVR